MWPAADANASDYDGDSGGDDDADGTDWQNDH